MIELRAVSVVVPAWRQGEADRVLLDDISLELPEHRIAVLRRQAGVLLVVDGSGGQQPSGGCPGERAIEGEEVGGFHKMRMCLTGNETQYHVNG